eukprot:CAMPEP_0172763458 /NCGR_PEP_ID=MMETSP1074-20121228/175364_1 /TAXON_ID=2916 /ORGANISM="Ceratium fusus, Strain PA161109" /LENGTH=42 /DNA_ID= /DNA_START= /DNA_END= /DNA_ORIENTATION=
MTSSFASESMALNGSAFLAPISVRKTMIRSKPSPIHPLQPGA